MSSRMARPLWALPFGMPQHLARYFFRSDTPDGLHPTIGAAQIEQFFQAVRRGAVIAQNDAAFSVIRQLEGKG